MKRFVAPTLIIALATFLLYHFYNIWRYGSFFIQEPNILILISETLLLLAILVYGIVRFWRRLGIRIHRR